VLQGSGKLSAYFCTKYASHELVLNQKVINVTLDRLGGYCTILVQ